MHKILHETSFSENPLSGKSASIFAEMEGRFAAGYYKFGDLLSAGDLAKEFGVSMQPIRSAIGQLRALGYIKVEPQVGSRVISPTNAEIMDFFCLFGRMEGVLAGLAAERHGQQQIAMLDKVAGQIDACQGSERGLPEHYARLVGEWHAVVRSLAHAPALAWRLRSFWSMSDFLLLQGAASFDSEQINIASQQRRAIRDAIKAKDAALAEQLMYEHVRGKPVRTGIVSKDGASGKQAK